MKGEIKDLYIKRTQRDYPLSFKLVVVREVESGAITDNGAMRKYGIQGHGTMLHGAENLVTLKSAIPLLQIL